ncbi:hypothetical protein C8R45DRAFT_964276 [Mycena sanguinolenta]|nr:hypothetical protein C8R45DRAFT_964276 [Mycena sanguinolenta]
MHFTTLYVYAGYTIFFLVTPVLCGTKAILLRRISMRVGAFEAKLEPNCGRVSFFLALDPGERLLLRKDQRSEANFCIV